MPARSSRDIPEATLLRMRDSLTHRGPDDAGFYLRPGIGLGHRRLSIVDVARGHQPMASEDGRYQVVYNGEIYNHPSLMQDLTRAGVAYRTHCDTETLLHLFERDREDCVRAFRGMFAFAIWDAERRELFLARDRFGVKPLYYVHAEDGTLWFGSEIKSLLAAGATRPELNRAALPDYLANHAPSADETLFAGVRRLPPGHTLTWRDGRIALREYWDLPHEWTPNVSASADALCSEYFERFREAVRMRLMADVPLGMFLSGGIDSAAITAVMSELVTEPVKTFSVAFHEREANELAYARLVARRFRTDHHEVLVTPDQFFLALPRLVWHEDEPLAHPSSIALYFVSELAARHVKVVLTGEGSDETLGGYNRYRVTVLNSRLGQWYRRATPAAVRGLIRSGLGLLPDRSRFRQRLERTFLTRAPDLDSLYFDNFAVFDRSWQGRLWGGSAGDAIRSIDPYAAHHAALARVPSLPLLERLLYADLKTYLHELLMKQDQMSMAASIESRVPFLDHELVEFTTTLPSRLRIDGLT
ncbi:MAG TPA: asparagine synthase (glutamine-hydrolyzing), partial [Gemmatimonadales bacterium]